jgi:hypothetical protein
MNTFYNLLDNFVEDLYADGTVDRWKREKAERKAGKRPCRYNRAAVMRSVWTYRKKEGLTMSAALKRAWADARRSILHLVA